MIGARSTAGARGARLLGAALLAAATLLSPGCGKKDIDKIPKDKDRSLTPPQLYDKGSVLLKRGRYYKSRQTFEKVLARQNVPSDLLADTNLAIADAYYYDGGVINVAEALSRYTSFLTFYPSHKRADYAQYQIGMAYLRQSLSPDKDQSTTRQALDAFRKVEITYPHSDFVVAARDKADECRARIAESEMRIGQFYLKRKAWPGAIERFRTVLENYPRYPRRDKACFLLAQALRNDKKDPEAQIYFQKIVDEYPKSRYAGQARAALESLEERQGKTAEAPRKKSSAVRTSEAQAQGGV